MKVRRPPHPLKLVMGIVLFLAFVTAAQSLLALPNQQFPCFGDEGCPERVNPEPDEYYSVQCTTNTIWIWRSVPALSIVTFITFYQVGTLGDGSSLSAPGNVSMTRHGDMMTLSGDNGNLAPQPGEKSFSWNECIERNGGLPELPPITQELSDEQIACLTLTTEQETADCLAALAAEVDNGTAQTCNNELYAQTHVEECFFVSCPLDPNRREADPSLCPDWLALLYEEINTLLSFCLGPPVT